MSTVNKMSDAELAETVRYENHLAPCNEALARLLERSKPVELKPLQDGSLDFFRLESILSLTKQAMKFDRMNRIEEALRVRNFIAYLEGLA